MRLIPAKFAKLLDQRGIFTESAAGVITTFAMIAVAMGTYSTNQYFAAQKSQGADAATLAAQAGVEHAVSMLNQDENYYFCPSKVWGSCGSGAGPGTIEGEIDLFNNSTQGHASYKVTLVDDLTFGRYANVPYVCTPPKSGNYQCNHNPFEVVVYVTGYYRAFGSSSYASKSAIAYLEATGGDFPDIARIGPGGLNLRDSAGVSGQTGTSVTFPGTIHVSGIVSMPYDAAGIGSYIEANEMWVAGWGCGSGASFPSPCASSSSSLNISSSTKCGAYDTPFVNVNILHYANNRAGCQPYVSDYQDHEGVSAPFAMPPTHRTEILSSIDRVVGGLNCTSGVIDWSSYGNVEVDGNVFVHGASGNNCTLILGGNLYIKDTGADTGRLLVENGGRIVLSETYRFAGHGHNIGDPIRSAPTIMADGAIDDSGKADDQLDNIYMSDNARVVPNSRGIGFIIIAMHCGWTGPSPNFTRHTCAIPADGGDSGDGPSGTDLAGESTQRLIFIDPNANSSGHEIDIDGSFLYARNGFMRLDTNTYIWGGGVAAQRLDMYGTATVIGGPKNSTYSNPLGGSSNKVFQVVSYQEVGS